MPFTGDEQKRARRFVSSKERYREVYPEQYRGMPGRVPEPRTYKTFGQSAEPYVEDWTDWPSKFARAVANGFVNRFGGSNISRRQLTEEVRGDLDVVASPATGATRAYKQARGGKYQGAAVDAALAAADVLPGKAAGAGVFILPHMIPLGKRGGKIIDRGKMLAERAAKLRRAGRSDADVLRSTGMATLRAQGGGPTDVFSAFELPGRRMQWKRNPTFHGMHDITEAVDNPNVLRDPDVARVSDFFHWPDIDWAAPHIRQ